MLETAKTKKEKLVGLMGRMSLPKGTGMLFQFSPPEMVRFSMYKTLISLDMIFLSNEIIVAIEKDVPICLSNHCPTYGPVNVVDGVIELAAGEAERLKINVGDHVYLQKISF